MIPEAITKDLRLGMSLEDTLIKHGTNLKELFEPAACKRERNRNQYSGFDDWTNIQPTKCNTYRVFKVMNRKRIEFGTYKTHEDALLVRNELIKCDWDKSRVPEIKEQYSIVTNTYGGARR